MPFMDSNAMFNSFYHLGTPHKLARGIVGITIEKENSITVPFFMANVEGRGDGGRFIAGLMEKYDEVRFPTVFSDILMSMLTRRGFKVVMEVVVELDKNEKQSVYLWERGQSS